MSYGLAILVVVMHVNSGSMVAMQEFRSEGTCEAARKVLYEEKSRARINLETAFCVQK